jgi:hypothetical protein
MSRSSEPSPLWWIPAVGGFIALGVAARAGLPPWLGFIFFVPWVFCAAKAASTIRARP